MIVAWLIFLKWINKMEYLVKSNTRWEIGSFYRIMSFDDILMLFFGGDYDEELDEMIQGVANLDINGSFEYEFFFNDVYTFKRIK